MYKKLLLLTTCFFITATSFAGRRSRHRKNSIRRTADLSFRNYKNSRRNGRSKLLYIPYSTKKNNRNNNNNQHNN